MLLSKNMWNMLLSKNMFTIYHSESLSDTGSEFQQSFELDDLSCAGHRGENNNDEPFGLKYTAFKRYKSRS